MIRQPGPTAKLCDEHVLDALQTSIPASLVRSVIADVNAGRTRQRKLPAELTLMLTVAMHLWPREALGRVLGKLLKGLRFVWPEPTLVPATKGAICQARYALGARPAAALFRRVGRPIATPETPGAFLFGLRVMAIDGTVENVPDTPANVRYFGRPSNQHGAVGYPQVRGVLLVECGTHAVVDAGFWPCTVSERVGGFRLLRSVHDGMLLLWDTGFHSVEMIECTRARGAHVLGRVPSGVRLPLVQRLEDGSYLTWLTTGKDWQRQRTERQRVRVLDYTLTDPNRPGAGERHRLVTTLLDPVAAPALDLICAYHERWESELVIDEIDTHQRLAQHLLRSHKPVGVLQELYGMLVAHFAIRAVMAEAAAQVPMDPRRLSFVHAVQLITDAIPEFQMLAPEQRLAHYEQLLADIRRHQLPLRSNRINPRVVRHVRRKYPPRRPHHRGWPQPTTAFRESVLLLN